MKNPPARYRFLLIGHGSEEQWPKILKQSLHALGKLKIVQEEDVLKTTSPNSYDLIVVDAGAVREIASLISCLRNQHSSSHVLVVTASPSWQAARDVLKAGATDYVSRSFDKKELCSRIKAVLALPSYQSNSVEEMKKREA
jgi:DNA-binding response OmpR family regulator